VKALVWQGEQRYSIEDLPDPKAGPGEVVVRVEAAAVCTSDFHMSEFGAKPPLVLGHEVAGRISETGPGVESRRLGERVALDPVMRCGTCRSCQQGIGHLCMNFRHLGWNGVAGGWAEYVVIDAANAHPVAPSVNAVAACLAEPAAVCFESFERAGLAPGDCVLILGDGPFGFLHAQIARARGASKIIVAGHHDRRLSRIAAQTQAIACNTHHRNLQEVLRAETGADGADIVIEATGAGASPNVGLSALRPRGTLVIFSYIWKPEPMDMGLIHMRELNVLGACRSLNAYRPCLDLLAQGKLNLETLVDVKAPLAGWRQAMDALAQRKEDVFKAVFLP
jgi:2-desacetyl-2-hydroxyethyl bacteriochlorophyllide A dehydrogenase